MCGRQVHLYSIFKGNYYVYASEKTATVSGGIENQNQFFWVTAVAAVAFLGPTYHNPSSSFKKSSLSIN